jgi:DNA polymerase-1
LTRTLLLDADLLAYKMTARNQRSYDWDGDGSKAVAADFEPAARQAEEAIEKLAYKLKADSVLVCLSDDFNSFRKDRVDPTYKAVRANMDRPEHLYDLKDYLAEEYEFVRWTALEADDVMGIIATDPGRTDERIIVSADKDLMGVPGKLYRPEIRLQGRLVRKAVMADITPIQAIRFHFWQTIVGDTTDGFPGAPGIGPKSPYAEDILAAETEEEAWDIVLQAYSLVGLPEAAAVQQARLARILQHEDWDGRSPRLWLPPAWEEPLE